MSNKFYILFLIIFIFNNKFLFAQSSISFSQNLKTFQNFSKVLKKTNHYKIDTIIANYGHYEKIIYPYIDKAEYKKRIKAEKNSEMTENAIFMMQQLYINSLFYYLKKVPNKYLQIIPYSQSQTLDSNWRKNSNAEEILDIENSLLLIFKDNKKRFELINLTFNPKNNKVIYLSIFGHPNDDISYIDKIINSK